MSVIPAQAGIHEIWCVSARDASRVKTKTPNLDRSEIHYTEVSQKAFKLRSVGVLKRRLPNL